MNSDFAEVQQNGKVGKNVTFEAVEKVVKKMRTDWGVSLMSKNYCLVGSNKTKCLKTIPFVNCRWPQYVILF